MRNPLTLIAAIAAFVITFSFLTEAGGATYYVDASGGSDGNNGLTTGAAWQTVAQVNSQTFSAGDTILFKRGEVWDDRLNITDSQTTWGAYGTGARPEIDASGDNYAIRVYGATTVTLQSLYATSGAIKMNWEGTAHTGLSAWQTASGQDANSIESNPQLDDYRDRYIPEIGSPVLGAGEGGGNIGWRGTHHSRYGGRGGFK